ncbi:MAG: pyridoxal-phosphate dependent enzyme, partial [Planctomycetota bacterium]|nr:pyridoxal-phosphate dependent enzyme [Planctomycetota bacterium]
VGMAKAFDEMRQLGWIDPEAPTPRMVAVQARGCAPVVEAFEQGRERTSPPVDPHTVAAGLCVPRPLGDRWMLRVLRDSHGMAVAVEDEDLVEGSFELARTEGVFGAPEAGALVAALRRLRSSGDIEESDEVVLFVTGTGLKYPEVLSRPAGEHEV